MNNNGNSTHRTRLILSIRHTRRRWAVAIAGIACLALGLLWSTPAYADDPVFTDSGQALGFSDSRDVALGDLDYDGDLDAVVANSSNQASLIWLNDGSGNFTDRGQTLTSSSVVNLGDVDGDGDLDIALGGSIWLNDGSGTFITGQAFGGGASIALGDLDGDGDLDAFVGRIWILCSWGCQGGENQVWLNNGNGVFTDSGQELSIIIDPDTEIEYGDSYAVALGDLDGDDDLDAFVGNNFREGWYPVTEQYNQVWINDGSGFFDPPGWTQPTDAALSWAVALGDVNDDGDLDAFVANHGANRVWFNLDAAPGTFVIWQNLGGSTSYAAALGDLDRDGDLDAFVGNQFGEANTVWLNNGSGTFSDSGQALGNSNTDDVALGDLDGDKDLDAFVANSHNQANKVWFNNGGSIFDDNPQDIGTGGVKEIAFGDLNNDGSLDAFLAGRFNPNTIWLNDGNGNLIDDGQSLGGSTTHYEVALGDLNGDGSLDAVVGSGGEGNKVWLNNGTGTLTDSGQVLSNTIVVDIALGDLDGDRDIDIFMVNSGPDLVWLNDGAGSFNGGHQTLEDLDTKAVALGDLDGDGDLDAFMANDKLSFTQWAPNRVWFNRGDATFILGEQELGHSQSSSVGLGDVDGDGDLDAFVGNDRDEANQLWLNDGQGLFSYAQTMGSSATQSVALGDLDGDGDLDALVGNADSTSSTGDHTIWLNNGQGDYFKNSTIATDLEYDGLALGDLDRDGDLDAFIPGDSTTASKVYLNSTADVSGYQVDVQKPGPTGNANFYATPVVLTNTIIPVTFTLAQADAEPVGHVEAFYSLNGGGHWLPAIATDTITTSLSTSPAGDIHLYNWDLFGSEIFGQYDNVVFRLAAYPQPIPTGITETTFYTDNVPNLYLWPSFGMQTFPFRVRGTQVRVYSETVHISNTVENAMVYRLPAEQPTGGTLLANSDGTPFRTDQHGYLQGRGEIGLGDRLFAIAPVHTAMNYAGALAFDGVDDYVIANPLNNAPITETTVSFWVSSTQTTGGAPLSYASPVTDNTLLITDPDGFVIYRGNGVSVTIPVTVTDGTWHHIAVTWRSTDGQIRLYKDGAAAYTNTLALGTVVSPGGSLVLGKDQNGANFFAGSLDEVRIWNTVLTENQVLDDMFGTLNGNEPGQVVYWAFDDPEHPARDQSGNDNDGTIEGVTWLGDYLGGYTVYHTSGTPIEDGVEAFTVTKPGVQVLTVTAQHPLILFDINVSLEWDASNDPIYLELLESDLKKASKHLYDFTDGQVALGQVNVFQNADNWATSHVLVHATNRLRPFAAQGGIVNSPTVDPDHDDPANPQDYIVYDMGQVHIGSTWNRYGTPGQNLGVDWPLILAHELGHYLFYLDDVYLGLNDDGLLIPVDTCTGSAMGDVYTLDNTEFISDTLHWTTNCTDTLTAKTLGRTEWETIHSWYPRLITPTIANAGPTLMPFDFSTITILPPTTEVDVLEDPTFYLDYAGGDVNSSAASAYLLRDAENTVAKMLDYFKYFTPTAGYFDYFLIAAADDFEYVYNLGSPIGGLNRLLARGARPGDRLCVFDRPRAQYGCEIITFGDERLQLEKDKDWTPMIQLSPVNSTTFGIQVDGLLTGLTLQARLYPEFGAGTEAITLALESGVYSGTFHLPYPALAGHVQVWVDEIATETNPRREAVVAYAIGGNPGTSRASGGTSRASGGTSRASGGTSRASGGTSRASGGTSRASGAPLVSPDGQMIFFTENPIIFDVGDLYIAQNMAGLPPLPSGKTTIGQGYNLVASPNVTRVITGSISFQYLGIDALVESISEREENQLTIYFWDESGWQALDTVRNTTYNLASAPSQGSGVYALMGAALVELDAHVYLPLILKDGVLNLSKEE